MIHITEKLIEMTMSRDKEMNSLADSILSSDWLFTIGEGGKKRSISYPKYMRISEQLYSLKSEIRYEYARKNSNKGN